MQLIMEINLMIPIENFQKTNRRLYYILIIFLYFNYLLLIYSHSYISLILNYSHNYLYLFIIV